MCVCNTPYNNNNNNDNKDNDSASLTIEKAMLVSMGVYILTGFSV